ncbi:MAG: hypothetical protein JNL05_06590 [Flavobacteriales bacterium]|nr:hypothetical protein [Flavobacteriales bacterium]
MKKNEENRMSMFYAVAQVCEKHSSVYGGLVPFVNAYGEFRVNLGALEGAVKRQELSLVGVALDKRTKRARMLGRAQAVANSVFAYAEDQGDAVLQAKVNYTPSSLGKGRDAVVGQRCQGIHAEATTALADLGAYGVSSDDLENLQKAIDAYVATIGSPRSALTVRKGATAEISALVKDSLKILNNRMDKLMIEFAESAPAFHQEYFDARMILDMGGRSSTEPEQRTPDEGAQAA